MDPDAESYDTEAAIINEILFTIGKIAAAGKPPTIGARIFNRSRMAGGCFQSTGFPNH